ncbi:hypothetical protein AB0B71_27050 [Micromonospora echinofusca]|uniref:hypothetical protein n=1 Tax=Micromonospora echinofusca TaxID=47858 RepID=UPI0034109227
MTTTLPADPTILTAQLIDNAYSHLGEIISLPAGHDPIRATGAVPAIMWRPSRDVPILSRSGQWARVTINIATYHHEGHLILDPDDLRYSEEGSTRVHPGYVDPTYAGLFFRLRRREEPALSRECGLYRTKQLWHASLRLTSID